MPHSLNRTRALPPARNRRRRRPQSHFHGQTARERHAGLKHARQVRIGVIVHHQDDDVALAKTPSHRDKTHKIGVRLPDGRQEEEDCA